MERLILDTSVFTNPDVYAQFGETAQVAIETFLGLARQVDVRFYMPTSVYEELGKVKDIGALAADFESVVRIRSPRKFSLMIPGEVLYEFIEEVRTRIDHPQGQDLFVEAKFSVMDPGIILMPYPENIKTAFGPL